ncbi:hypothetical protein BU17DRAFT_95917 [Hysterangium stoloniferum]|nr:hypothetical protein BU17DRAFT_95917 [Hysterangium stoloniferum]
MLKDSRKRTSDYDAEGKRPSGPKLDPEPDSESEPECALLCISVFVFIVMVPMATLVAGDGCRKARRRERAAGLTKDLNRAHEELLIQAEKISAEHNRTTQWTKSQLLLGSKMQGQKRSASAWNAFTRKEMEAVNKNLPLGQCYTLPKYIQQHYQDVKARYNGLSDEDYAALIEELCDVREDRNAIKCRQPKAVLRDVTATFQALTHEIHAAHLCTGIETFYVAARSSLDQTHEPKSYFSPIAQQFCKDVLNMD